MSVTVTDPTSDFQALFADQTEDVILARMMDWANEGLDPVADSDSWVDTREGGHWRTAVMPCVRELARLYDLAGTEVPMSGFVLWAWGTYLDDLAAVYEVDRKAATFSVGAVTFTGPAASVITAGTAVGTVPASPDDPAPTFLVDSTVTIPDLGGGNGQINVTITAQDAGQDGDVAAHSIVAPGTPLPAGVTVDNASATLGGTDPETDDALRTRVLQAIVGRGPGAIADYLRWAGAWPGVGAVKVVPTPTGPNTVLVLITDPEGQPLPGSVVTALQTDLDPIPGKGEGTAPVGAQVDVETSTPLAVTITLSTITYEDGYSADGAGNTVAVQPGITAAINNYLLTCPPGGEVVVAHAAGIISTWPGVHDVTGVEVNGSASNLAIGLTPPESPFLSALTL